MGVDLLGQLGSHLGNVSFSVVLVSTAHQEHHFWKDQSDVVFNHFHVLRIALEAVDEHP